MIPKTGVLKNHDSNSRNINKVLKNISVHSKDALSKIEKQK